MCRIPGASVQGFRATGVVYVGFREGAFLNPTSLIAQPPYTHGPLSSSFWGLPYRILNMNHKKELLKGPMGSSSCLTSL